MANTDILAQTEIPMDPFAAVIENLMSSAQIPLTLVALAALPLLFKMLTNRSKSSYQERDYGHETLAKLAAMQPDPQRLVVNNGYRVVPLLNRLEARVLPMLEKIAREMGEGHRVLAQVALSQVVHAVSPDGTEDTFSDANKALAGEHLDLALLDRRGFVVAAIECHATTEVPSDFQISRSQAKRDALAKAGLKLIDLPPEADEALVRLRLAEMTALPVRPAQPRIVSA
ncbi:DUF2726 domain-containing protein [Sedimentimonas flavescens]|uniref:DUF2726 domain-containing protein n=1 Tax=Sedimentimonas flavescens TaxID=2851012 RepID=UPI0021A7053C|nr:DUF2726 domain-containing protein [Sedimentimonas flavescens]MCT2538560.1 DUF2726 domain-containing protein [Sedimentimonas flavescens]WBL34407.1 DUF2726 domain-containing protein [Sinirhodobacter sp. HNIBRBA609]